MVTVLYRVITWSLLMAAGVTLSVPGQVMASCGSTNCFLVTGTQEGLLQPGQVVMDLSYRYIPQDRKLKGSSSTQDVLVPAINFDTGEVEPDRHREVRTINMLTQLDMHYGMASNVSLALSIPVSNRRYHEHYHVEDITDPTMDAFSNVDGTSGMGDISVMGQQTMWATARHLLMAGVLIKLPTGEYKLRDSDGAINEPTIMPGTGSYDVSLSGYYAYELQPHFVNAFLSLSYRWNAENPLDYKFGSASTVNAGLNVVPAENVTLTGQVNAQFSEKDAYKGERVPSTGGTFVYFTPGVRLQAASNMSLYSHLQIPVYQKVNEVNLAPRYGLLLGVSYAF